MVGEYEPSVFCERIGAARGGGGGGGGGELAIIHPLLVI